MISLWFMIAVTLLYAGACVADLVAGRYPGALMYAGFVVANVGITLRLYL